MDSKELDTLKMFQNERAELVSRKKLYELELTGFVSEWRKKTLKAELTKIHNRLAEIKFKARCTTKTITEVYYSVSKKVLPVSIIKKLEAITECAARNGGNFQVENTISLYSDADMDKLNNYKNLETELAKLKKERATLVSNCRNAMVKINATCTPDEVAKLRDVTTFLKSIING
jgi:hypothetical protein